MARSTGRWLFLLVALGALSPALAWGHRLAPALLQIEDTVESGVYRMRWQEPAVSSAQLEPHWPAHCQAETQGGVRQILTPTGRAAQTEWLLRCEPHSLAGGELGVTGLAIGTGFVLLRINFSNGVPISHMLSHAEPSFTVPTHWSGNVLISYLKLGMEHILSGYDHLLFVFGLLLLCHALRELLFTITAFTVGHSVTLGLATFNIVLLPLPVIDYAIILSILYIAVMAARREVARRAQRLELVSAWQAPWVAMLFGLLHGQGFSAFLLDIGLPPGKLPSALLGFNLGIEIGQLLFVGLVVAIALSLSRIRRLSMPRLRLVWVELMGALSALWVVQSSVALLS